MNGKTCLIVGGGISGLLAGNILKDNGFDVTIIDKGRGIGGRLATRRIENQEYGVGIFDYGAQFFTSRDKRFMPWVNQWINEGIVKNWSEGFLNSEGKLNSASESFYRGTENNRSIMKYLAKKFKVYTNQRIIKIEKGNSDWTVISDEGNRFSANILILTPPVPQILSLLNDSLIPLPVRLNAELSEVTYSQCIAILALLKSKSNIPNPGGVKFDSEPVSWMADNYVKGISPNGYAVTIHAGPKYSEENWGKEDDLIANEIFDHLRKWLQAEIAEYQIHRWRYSQVLQRFRQPFLHVKEYGLLFFAGDGFGGARVEGAVLSGIQVAEAIIQKYNL